MNDRLLAQQLSAELKMPLADSRRFDTISPEVIHLLPEATLAALRVVPLAFDEEFVVVACAEPHHFRYMKELARYLKRPVRPMLATRRDIARTLLRLYGISVPEGWLPAEEPLDGEDDRLTLPPQARSPLPEGHSVEPSPPAAAQPPLVEEEEPEDATIPMTAAEVQRVLADYAAQLELRSSSPGALSPPPPIPEPPPVPPPPPLLGESGLAAQLRPPIGRPSVPGVVVRPKSSSSFRERFQMVKRIAVGGMAEVYLARAMGAEGFQREVVVKKILPCFTEDPSFVEMFIDEAKIACRLNHPNIAQVYELASEAGEYYMVMEYVEGKDLLTLMESARRKGQRLPPIISAYIVASILDGLEHAHRKTDERGELLGIIHRDITPSNILISYEGHVKIIDFGIAKAREKLNVTRVGYMKGKPGYLAPEQARGEPLDRRVDLFAAGILLYELLSNKRLFSDSARASVMARLVTFDINPLVRFNFRIPWALRSVLRKSLALNVADRFDSAQAMSEQLQTFLRRKARRDPRFDLRSYLLKHFSPGRTTEGPTTR